MIEQRKEANDGAIVPYVPLLRRPPVYRLVIVALLAEIGYAVMNISAMGPFLLLDLKMTRAEAAWVLTAFLLSEALSKGPMGHLADKFGRKNFMMFGPLLSVGTAIISVAIPSGLGTLGVLAFMCLRLFDGVGLGMLWPAAYSTLSEIVPEEERQQGMSYLNLCYILGVALAFPIGGAVTDLFHTVRASFWLAAGMFLSIALAVHYLIPNTSGTSHSTSPEHGESLSVKQLIAAASRNPIYILLAFITFMGVGAPMLVIQVFPMEVFHLSESAVGVLVLPVALAMAALNGPMAKVGQRMGRSQSVHLGLGLCAAGMLVIASGQFLPFMRSPVVLGLGAMPVGIGFLLAIPAWYAAVSDLDPQNRGINIGMIMTGQGLGAIAGNLAGSYLSDHLAILGGKTEETQMIFRNYMPFSCSTVFIAIGWILSLRILGASAEPKETPVS